jgi:hypothetical protein
MENPFFASYIQKTAEDSGIRQDEEQLLWGSAP